MLDEIRHGGQVSQDAQRTQVGVVFRPCRDGDACHNVDYSVVSGEWKVGNGEFVWDGGSCIMLEVLDIRCYTAQCCINIVRRWREK